MKFIDLGGLTTFWGKVKSYVTSNFVSNADAVHKTGNETISGTKTFETTGNTVVNLNTTGASGYDDMRFQRSGTAQGVIRLTAGNTLQVGAKSTSATNWYDGALMSLTSAGGVEIRAQNGANSNTLSMPASGATIYDAGANGAWIDLKTSGGTYDRLLRVAAQPNGNTGLYVNGGGSAGWLCLVDANWNKRFVGNADTATTAASCTGNAATATSATNAGIATKLGTATVGGANNPVYISGGTAKAGNTFVPNTGGTFSGAVRVGGKFYLDLGYIYASDPSFSKGKTPSETNYIYQLLATDAQGESAAYRLGAYQVYVMSNGTVCNEVSTYPNISGNSTQGAALCVWQPKSGTGYVTIPNARPEAGDSSTKLPDTAWVHGATVASAGSAGTITSTLPVSKGGTGATTLASAGIATKVAASNVTYASSTAHNGYYEINNGGTKVQVAWGRVSASSAGNTKITFARAFGAAPHIVAAASPGSDPSGSGNNLSVLTGPATTTGASILVRNTTGAAITAWANYIAIGTGA